MDSRRFAAVPVTRRNSAQEWASKHSNAGIRVAGVGGGGLRLLLGEGDGHEVHLTNNPWAISTNDAELEGA